MKTQIDRLDAVEQLDELLPMLDRAFGHHEGRFLALLPGLYQRSIERLRCHYVVRINGRIAAALGAYPLQWCVGGRVLNMAGIGGVGTDTSWRGKGLMSDLLQHLVSELRREGFALSWLAGQRQRYRHYGWETAGCQLRYDLVKANLRHEPSLDSLPPIELTPLRDASSVDITQLQQWHDAQSIHCIRKPEEFEVLLHHWHAQPMAAHDPHGEPVGYVVLGKDGQTVTELVGRDETARRAIVRAVVARGEDAMISLLRPAMASEMNRWLGTVAEQVICARMGNWQVFDWPQVIEALLAVRCQNEAPPSGSVVLGIEGEPRALRLAVDGEEATVQWCDQPPALTLGAPTMTRLLLGPLKPSQVVALPREASVLEAWCPLPAALPGPDKV